MSDLDKDTRTFEEIKAGWKKNGLVFGKVMSSDDMRQAKADIKKVNDKIHRKENKLFDREFSRKNKPAIFVSLCGVFEKVLHIIVTLYTMAIVVNIFFGWQIYKAISAGGWHGIIETPYPLYIAAYFVLFFILKWVYLQLYKYAHD